ncbi:MAG TPA: CBS and ACT domain-containing protein [Roseiflexaceae bacterium]|nr:CBS and ACT domain-containing protein [Roseiflexaceae bacterium]
MLIRERMSQSVNYVTPETSVADALNFMKSQQVRRLPVLKRDKLVGIVSDKDLLNASPPRGTSLSAWELTYLLGKLTIGEIMSREVLTVTEDMPIEEAARIMADHKIGGLPVMRNGEVVGMITETDLFKTFLEMMGARRHGVRLTVLVPEEPGQLARLTEAIASIGGNILALGTFVGEHPSNRMVTCKIDGVELERVRARVEPLVERLVDIRETYLEQIMNE